MTRPTKREARRIGREFAGEGKFDKLLDRFQELDRTVLELYMQIYQTPANHQSAMRAQNRRLHRAISKPLRRILSNSTSMSRNRRLR